MSDYPDRLLKEAKELESRWSKTGLLNGISDSYKRANLAVLLENQRLMNENPVDTTDLGQFKRINIPLVRRIHPQMYNHPIQPLAADVQVPTDLPTPRKPKKQLRSLDDEWEA